MKRVGLGVVAIALTLGLVACGPPRKSIFPPLVSVQELHVQADGSWHMQLRIQNNSYAGVTFQALHLDMKVGEQEAGRIDATPDLDIPALAVDVAEVDLRPAPAAAQALQALQGDGRASGLSYRLEGTVRGKPEQEDEPRDFTVHGKDWLSPVPGLPDTYR